MCGIAGFWKPAGLGEHAARDLQAMIEIQHHRGPDGDGHYIDERNKVALGHQRLSLVDLYTGKQPIHSQDKQITIIHNGEFYDYKKLRSRQMTLGHRFSTRSDSETCIPLYQRYGLDFVQQLRGEFAFALWDANRERLVLVRDRFGIRPLFWHFNGESLYFASEVKGVLAHHDVPRRLSPKGTLNQLMHTMVPGTSAFEGINAVKPGHMLIVQRRGDRLEVEQKCYWDMEFPDKAAHKDMRPEQEYVDEVREKLVEAVTLRLEADVPVGCYLSGGIDSCSILGMASGAQQAPVKAFTISFAHSDYDEAAIAKEMALSVGADQDVISVGADELYGDNYVRTVWHAERTFYNTLGVAKWCMSKHVHSAGYKTVITGEGADELFGGYPALKRDMFLHGLDEESSDTRAAYEKALQESNRVFRGAILAENQETHPAWEDLVGFTPSWIQPWIATLEIARPLLADSLQEELEGYDPLEAIAEQIDPDKVRGRHALDKAQYTWSKTMLEGQILNWGGDRVDMANSMESRPAFLDHHVAESAVNIPPSLRIRGNTEKWVLREAMRGVLPEVLYKRQKFAFMAPPAHTNPEKRVRVQQLIDDFLTPDHVAEAGILDSGRVDRFLKEWKEDNDPISLVRKDALLNHLLCLHILHRQYIANKPTVPGVWSA